MMVFFFVFGKDGWDIMICFIDKMNMLLSSPSVYGF